jgi:hypothetical protein
VRLILFAFLAKRVGDHAILFSMELIFEVREAEEGGYTARSPGHSIVAEADTWEALRKNVREAAKLTLRMRPRVQRSSGCIL